MTAPVSHRSSKPVAPKPLSTTPEQLGGEVLAAQTSATKLEDAEKALKTAKEAFAKASPGTKAAAKRALEGAQSTRDKAYDVAMAAESKVTRSMATLQGSKLSAKAAKLHAAYEDAVQARDAEKPGSPKYKQLEAAVGALGQALEKRESDNLVKARWDHKLTTNAQANLDGIVDLASRSTEEQIKLAGAPVATVTNDQAVAFDRQKVSYSLRLSTSSGLSMLAAQLEGADEATQLKLLKSLGDPSRDRLSQLIAGAGEAGGGAAFVEVLGKATGAARQQLLDRVAKTVTGPSHDLVGWLGHGLQYKDNFAVTAEFTKALQRAGKTEVAEALMGAAAKDVSKLRTEFDANKKVVDKLNAEFARTVAGFAGAVDPKGLEAYRDRFVRQHQAAFEKFNASAEAYLEIFKGAASDKFGDLGMNPYSGSGQLSAELRLALDHSEAVLDSQPGRNAMDAAMKLQMIKQPSWLDEVSASAKVAKNDLKLPGKVADFAAKAMIRVAVGKGLDQADLNLLIKKNAALLGITDKAATKFNEVLNEINNSGLTDAQRAAAYEKAAGEIKAGSYGGKSLAALGVLLTAPGIIKGLFNFKDKDLVGKLSVGVDTLSFGKDLVSLFSDAKVLGTVGKFTGGASAAIGLVKSVMALSDGKLFEGGVNLASAVGGALMLVPGGQVFGAALVVASAIASAIWGDDPAARAEEKQQENVREFLVDAGLKPEIAQELSDVRQKDHRSVGPFIEQMAGYLQLKPTELLAFLNEQSPAKVRSLVKMVKEMPADDQWQFSKARRATDVGDTTGAYAGNGVAATWTVKDPQSLETAKTWMKAHDLLPPNAK